MLNKTGMKIAKKYEDKIELIEKDVEGVWGYTEVGFKFDSMDAHTARTDNQKELFEDIKTIVPCDCEECERLQEEAKENETATNESNGEIDLLTYLNEKEEAKKEAEDNEEVNEVSEYNTFNNDKIYTTQFKILGFYETVVIEVKNDDVQTVLVTVQSNEKETFAGCVINNDYVDFGHIVNSYGYGNVLLNKVSDFVINRIKTEIPESRKI